MNKNKTQSDGWTTVKTKNKSKSKPNIDQFMDSQSKMLSEFMSTMQKMQQQFLANYNRNNG